MRKLQCDSCGAALTPPQDPRIKALNCAHCGSTYNHADTRAATNNRSELGRKPISITSIVAMIALIASATACSSRLNTAGEQQADAQSTYQGHQLVRTRNLGLQFVQHGEVVRLTPKGVHRAVVHLKRDAFEIRVPDRHWSTPEASQRALKVAISGRPRIFDKVAVGEHADETPFFKKGTGYATYRAGSGQLRSIGIEGNKTGHNYIIDGRFDSSTSEYRGLFVSSIIDMFGDADFLADATSTYVVAYMNTEDDGQHDILRRIELDFIEIHFDQEPGATEQEVSNLPVDESRPIGLGWFDDWMAYKSVGADQESCFIASIPDGLDDQTDARTRTFLMVRRRDLTNDVLFNAGYKPQDLDEVIVAVDDRQYRLQLNETAAWVADQTTAWQLIEAMSKDSKFTIAGLAKGDVIFIDDYSLQGFNRAIDAIETACRT